VPYFSSFSLDGMLVVDRRVQLIDYFPNGQVRGVSPTIGKVNVQQITLANGKSYPLNIVRGTLYLLMSSPEYQLN